MDNLSGLSPDLFIQQITYLPFSDVINICNANKTLYSYCTDPKYAIRWKSLINNTFGNVYNYDEKLRKTQENIKLQTKTNEPFEKIYNYLVYTQLVKRLDPITQAMIYYQQGDMNSFNKFTNIQKFLALFLLNKRDIIEIYLPHVGYLKFIDFMDKKLLSQDDLNSILLSMAGSGNMKGLLMLKERGADIHYHEYLPFRVAVEKGHLDIVKYLLENGAKMSSGNNDAIRLASFHGYLDIIKYLIENGADIYALDGIALEFASKNGHLNLVRFLLENYTFNHDSLYRAIREAKMHNHIEIVKQLERFYH